MPNRKIHPNFSKGVFAAENSTQDYLDPKNHPPTSMVEITDEELNPYRKRGVRIFAKLFTSLPSGQIKSIPVSGMVKEARKSGKLKTGKPIVEATSGNTGNAEALFDEAIVIVKPGTAEGKITYLQLLGATVIVREGGVQYAPELANKYGYTNLDQYSNQVNPQSFSEIAGPQIWDQTDGQVDIFCAGMGSTGTIVGIGGYLKKQKPALQTIGVIVKAGEEIPGVRTRKRLQEISFDWKSFVDNQQEVGEEESYSTSLAIIRNAKLLAGPSSGFALRGLLQYLEELDRAGNLDKIVKEKNGLFAVFPVPDGPQLYLEEYKKRFAGEFPEVIEVK
jgi:cysteine synthase